MTFNLRGNRKFILGMSYLVVSLIVALCAIFTTTDAAIGLAWAGIPAAIAIGLRQITTANVEVHKINAGKGVNTDE